MRSFLIIAMLRDSPFCTHLPPIPPTLIYKEANAAGACGLLVVSCCGLLHTWPCKPATFFMPRPLNNFPLILVVHLVKYISDVARTKAICLTYTASTKVEKKIIVIMVFNKGHDFIKLATNGISTYL